MNEPNRPFYQTAEHATEFVKQGATVFQKFTCSTCGNRLTMQEPNVFYKEGTCDLCGSVTDIERDGCNYVLLAALNAEGAAKMPKVLAQLRATTPDVPLQEKAN